MCTHCLLLPRQGLCQATRQSVGQCAETMSELAAITRVLVMALHAITCVVTICSCRPELPDRMCWLGRLGRLGKRASPWPPAAAHHMEGQARQASVQKSDIEMACRRGLQGACRLQMRRARITPSQLLIGRLFLGRRL